MQKLERKQLTNFESNTLPTDKSEMKHLSTVFNEI